MATIIQMKSNIEVNSARSSDEDSKFQIFLDFDGLSELNSGELDKWIEDYINQLPEKYINSEPKSSAK
jgi:hypothetical protein